VLFLARVSGRLGLGEKRAVLSGLAEFESSLIRARTGEGRERAKARGVKMGPKFKLTPHPMREAIRRRDTKGEPVREIARMSMFLTARFNG
jgi:DNA invertase Pin-like site-specific DNA recombinase